MSHLQYTAKSHHLQWNVRQLSQICHHFYHNYCPDSFKYRRNVGLVKVSDESLLVLLLIQAELGITSQRHSYTICHLFPCGQLLERSRFNRRSKQLIWLVQLIRKAMSEMLPSDKLAIIDSFPLPLCQPVRNHRVTIFKGLADIGYNASKHLWFYGFKVHMLMTLSGYILNYVVTPASVHDIKVVYELLEGCKQSVILGDLGYLSSELKKDLEQEGYHLWAPFRKNMTGSEEHNNWKVMAMRRTIETCFSELCRLFDIEHTLARSLAGLQSRIEQIILAHNLRYFEMH
ncbi:TPA: IS982 family transposase [Streptococcus suis]|uniref:IS982 family transposase n=1 Tax=Streptococcus suis TaxID=1307 RepID=A0AAP6A622_STRSU|nr:IS982 family transposase [Streptococcus suis]MCB2908644.1 IS982 family transposase [Streptococcus suis]MCO0826167.1 IS982 family transposase [Streptococcus suis]MCO0828202.1 IS982 family transposase [Streptococcus suis]MCO0846850.1 IS982 family transposase [Streptococcus suis]MCO0854296.1 IS982 family transposase [Streptococcus suis]